MHSNKPTIRYTIDAEDRVTFVDAEWMSFVAQNGAPELTSANIVGKPIWGFLADEEVNHLYELMFATVRARGRKLTLPFRCDSPTNRRFMELTVTFSALADKPANARQAGEPWLAYLDASDYASTWNATAPLFQSQVGQNK